MAGAGNKTYIAILRGINLGGRNSIKMTELVRVFENLGFLDVKSYIQSGNIVFKSKKTEAKKLQQQIHAAIVGSFKLDVPVLVVEAANMERIRDENPYVQQDNIDPSKLHITFLEHVPDAEKVTAIEAAKYLPDEFTIKGAAVYLHCPVAYGTTKLNNGFFENKLKVLATTRNWKTVNTLVEMAGE